MIKNRSLSDMIKPKVPQPLNGALEPSIKLSLVQSTPRERRIYQAKRDKKIYERMDLDKFEKFTTGFDFLNNPLDMDLRASKGTQQ